MGKTSYLNRLIQSGTFRFEKLVLQGVDNIPILEVNTPGMAEEEVCLFQKTIDDGNQYLEVLHKKIGAGFIERRGLPIVRFADGEYAFYRHSLKCNGLYQQAESVGTLRRAMPAHVEALQILAKSGILAPLVFPGNTQQEQRSLFSFWRKSKTDSSALNFLDFLFTHGVELNQDNYVPFYVVYAYLSSGHFARRVHHKKVSLIASEFHRDSCQRWFARFSSEPFLTFVDIPESYVATQWTSLKEKTLRMIPPDTELALVGAGVGALLICVDVAERLAIPAIDAGHVFNMMNGREEKSKGPRLYTIWEKPESKEDERSF